MYATEEGPSLDVWYLFMILTGQSNSQPSQQRCLCRVDTQVPIPRNFLNPTYRSVLLRSFSLSDYLSPSPSTQECGTISMTVQSQRPHPRGSRHAGPTSSFTLEGTQAMENITITLGTVKGGNEGFVGIYYMGEGGD